MSCVTVVYKKKNKIIKKKKSISHHRFSTTVIVRKRRAAPTSLAKEIEIHTINSRSFLLTNAPKKHFQIIRLRYLPSELLRHEISS